MPAELDALVPNICHISGIDPHDFCNLCLYPGHRGYPGGGPYLGRGLGFAIEGDDDAGDKEPVDDQDELRLRA